MGEADLSALDPQARRFLAMVALGGRGSAVGIDERRRGFAKLMQFSKPPAAAAVASEDSVIAIGKRTIPLRCYTPGGLDRPSAGLVYFHGGGLVAGGLDTHDALCRTLAHGARCQVVAIDYRLAPEHPFPAAVVDALVATRFVLRHAASFGLDPRRVAVGGDSGGGTLAAIVSQGLQKRLRAQVLLCPALDFAAKRPSRRRFADGFLLDSATLAADLVHYAPQRPLEDRRISPLRAGDLAGLPTTVLHTASFDPLVDEGAAYARRLVDAGVDVRHREHAALMHHFYALNGVVPAAQVALDAIARDIAEVLG